ncbi:MAG: nitroreductase family protein [Bacteroidales bacterium]|nr:nitroreductase family protein [Bacteroidales bacterium]
MDKHIANLNFETRFSEMVSTRYTCNSFIDRKINPSKIDKMLKVARIAPSQGDCPSIHVWAVTSDEALARMREVHPTFNAPAVFMVGCDRAKAWVRRFDNKSSADTDAAVVSMHILLEASDLGLGTVWLSEFDPAKVAELFPETAGYEITALLAVGHPDPNEEPGINKNERQPLEEFATVL